MTATAPVFVSSVVPDGLLADPGKATVCAASAALFAFDFFEPLPVQMEVSDAPLTSDAGLLPLRQFDERIGLTSRLAAALDDPRDPDLTGHTFPEMVRSRVYGILAGYADQNDHDTLRHDPVFKLLAGRSPDDDDLASQPTLSRFENAISIRSRRRWRAGSRSGRRRGARAGRPCPSGFSPGSGTRRRTGPYTSPSGEERKQFLMRQVTERVRGTLFLAQSPFDVTWWL
jgi:hypothetical protein